MWQTCKTTAPFILCLFISAYNAVVNLSLTTFSPVLWLTKETMVSRKSGSGYVHCYWLGDPKVYVLLFSFTFDVFTYCYFVNKFTPVELFFMHFKKRL